MKLSKELEEQKDRFHSVKFDSVQDLVNKMMYYKEHDEWSEDTTKDQAVVIYDFIYVSGMRINEAQEDEDVSFMSAVLSIAVNLLMHVKGVELEKAIASVERVREADEKILMAVAKKDHRRMITSVILTADITMSLLDDEDIERLTKDIIVDASRVVKSDHKPKVSSKTKSAKEREELMNRLREMFEKGE